VLSSRSPQCPASIPESIPAQPKETSSAESPACFPASATVELDDGSVVRMDALRVGHRVRTGRDAFSDVYVFTHRQAAAAAAFIRIDTTSGHTLRATAGHYIHVNGALAAAGTVQLGDALVLGSGASTTVASISVERGVGLYNPQTLGGDIVVDSVLASTYTRAVDPAVAHAALAPVRVMYEWLGIHPPSFHDGGGTLAARFPQGRPRVV
jgi:hypothetical protein